MRLAFMNLIGVAATLAIVANGTPAYALGAKAAIVGGLVNVSGTQAKKSAPVFWEGIAVATANKGGNFAFTTTVIPADCVGTLSDGTSSIDVTVDGCYNATGSLPGTGQTISYAPGDDGAVRAGGALSYTDNGDGTLTDNRTGLTWEKKTDDNVKTNYTWQAALDYVASLNATNFAGHSDWRLPNVRELMSIIDYGRSNPSIDPIFGPTSGNTNFVTYWSSTSWAAYNPAGNAWGVEFRDAYDNLIGAMPFGKSSYLRVRAVRGGL
jgi:hypothetical protein